MALIPCLQTLLDKNKVPYEVLPHREAFTAQRVAQATHVAGRLLAKAVVVRESDDAYYMAVVTAAQHVDLELVHHVSGHPRGTLATESELLMLFPDCEVGAMPPIGKLWNMPTYIDVVFRGHEDIYFQAGNHHEVVKMNWYDFEKIAGPFAGEFLLHREEAAGR
jgi:Ala-tRNA(Pro) deacylase